MVAPARAMPLAATSGRAVKATTSTSVGFAGGAATDGDQSRVQQATHVNSSGIDAQYEPSKRRGNVASRLKAIRRSTIVADPIPDPSSSDGRLGQSTVGQPAPLNVELTPTPSKFGADAPAATPRPLTVLDSQPTTLLKSDRVPSSAEAWNETAESVNEPSQSDAETLDITPIEQLEDYSGQATPSRPDAEGTQVFSAGPLGVGANGTELSSVVARNKQPPSSRRQRETAPATDGELPASVDQVAPVDAMPHAVEVDPITTDVTVPTRGPSLVIPPTSAWETASAKTSEARQPEAMARRLLDDPLAKSPTTQTLGDNDWSLGILSSADAGPLVDANANKSPVAANAESQAKPLTVSTPATGFAAGEAHTETIPDSEQIAPFTVDATAAAPTAAHTANPQESVASMADAVVSKGADSPAEVATDVSLTETPEADAKVDENVLFDNQSPVLSVQTRGPRTIKVGRTATYEVDMVNASDYGAQDVVVNLVVPSWAEASQHTVSVGTVSTTPDEQGNSVLSWTIRHLDGKSQENMKLELIPRTSRPFDLGISWTFTPASSLTQIEVQEPKLQMAIVGPSDVLFGETKLYTIMISNPGTGDAENVVLSLLPISDGQGTPGVREMGLLKAGTRRTVEVELTAHQAGRLMVRAQASADGGLQAQTDQEVLVRRANLEIEIVDSGAPVQYAGTNARYAVRVTNTGDATAREVTAVAALPTGAKFVSSTEGGVYDAATSKVTWTVDSLRPGAVQIYEMVCVLNEAGKNRIDVRAKADEQLAAAGSITTEVESLADLKLLVNDPQGAIPVGSEMVYEVRVVNRGTKEARNIDVIGYFSEGIEPTAVRGWRAEIEVGQVIFEQIPRLGPGQEMIVRVAAQANRAGDHVFRAELESTDPETKLAVEEWTRFFGDPVPARQASRSNAANPESLPPERLEVLR